LAVGQPCRVTAAARRRHPARAGKAAAFDSAQLGAYCQGERGRTRGSDRCGDGLAWVHGKISDVERFIDRLRGGKLRPYTPDVLSDPVEYENTVREQASEQFLIRNHRAPTMAELDQLTRLAMERSPIRGVEKFDQALLSGIPVIAADDVARYCTALPAGTDVSDVVATMAPPFNRFFVDIQNVPNHLDASAWGVYVEALENPEAEPRPGDDGVPRWLLHLQTFLEVKPWLSAGPVTTHLVGLAEDGTWFRHADGDTYFGARIAKMEPEPPPRLAQHDAEAMLEYVLPVLFALSLMHCRNVEIRTVEPDSGASRAHRRRHRHRLVRYQVLDIEPMRRILDRAGATDPTAGGLRRALTICRGHFKTFSPDAPLFGKHTGQFWWAPHIRGNPDAGIVVNDYRVHAPGEIGGAYRQASETAPDELLPAPTAGDPDASGAGWVEHNKTQNLIARIVASQGFAPRSPRAEEPRYDLAWARGQTVWVAEVKSVTSQNEERQLRTAMGQVLRYRQKLTAGGHDVQAVIVASRMLSDPSWDELCRLEGIVLIWPEVAEERLGAQEHQP
jgi:hypothetical protein